MLRHFACAMLLIILALVLLQLSDQAASLFAMGRISWRALAVSQLLAAVFFAVAGFRQFRCPACGEIVRGHDRYYLGVVIDPKGCPHCGRRLK